MWRQIIGWTLIGIPIGFLLTLFFWVMRQAGPGFVFIVGIGVVLITCLVVGEILLEG